MAELPFHTYDVFTSRRYEGNPLAVVETADALGTEQMQTSAREFNLSETIFIQRPADPTHTAKVRIFYPKGEMPFAGHPTIGCAIHLAEEKNKGEERYRCTIRLEEEAGLVPVDVVREGGAITAQLTAPGKPNRSDVDLPERGSIAAALGLEAKDIGIAVHKPAVFAIGFPFLFIPLASREALAGASPYEPHWSALTGAAGSQAAYCYCASGHADVDFHSRMFDPGGGIFEDPATGSATSLLAAQLAASNVLEEGANRFVVMQGEDMGRPSRLVLEADFNSGVLGKIRIAGSAIRVMSGVLHTP